jgi:acrylyl-CoA reductase (NADPH)
LRAFVAEKTDDGVTRGVREFELDAEGDVLIRVAWSSVNYKDALATVPKGGVARISPLVPGIDLAGVVEEGGGSGFAVGDEVLAHGYELGMSHHGGFAEHARVPAGWVVPLRFGLSPRDAMAIGTAGYTAALSILALERRGLTPSDGPVLVTGATGGVGSMAVDMLAGRGYEVVASTGKGDAEDFLRELGAASVISREEVVGDASRPLARSVWAGAVDCVGGAGLSGVLRGLKYGAAVAASGNTGGIALEDATVLPFILRGVALLGIDSAQTPIGDRIETWARIAGDLRPRHLDAREIGLDDLEDALTAILRGESRGRTIVRVGG